MAAGNLTIQVSWEALPPAAFLTSTIRPDNRSGVGLTLENTLIGIGGSGIGNLFQEFLIRRLTPHAARDPQANNP